MMHEFDRLNSSYTPFRTVSDNYRIEPGFRLAPKKDLAWVGVLVSMMEEFEVIESNPNQNVYVIKSTARDVTFQVTHKEIVNNFFIAPYGTNPVKRTSSQG